MNHHHLRQPKTILSIAGFMAVAALLVTWSPTETHGQDNANQNQNADIMIGTYDPQAAFQAYPEGQEFVAHYQSAQQRLAQAQQNGDQQQVMAISQELQQRQQKVAQDFQQKIEQVLPEAAEQANVDIVALEVMYTSENIGTKEITRHVVEALGGDQQSQTQLPQP